MLPIIILTPLIGLFVKPSKMWPLTTKDSQNATENRPKIVSIMKICFPPEENRDLDTLNTFLNILPPFAGIIHIRF